MFGRLAASAAAAISLCVASAAAQTSRSETDLYMIFEQTVVPAEPTLTIEKDGVVMETFARSPRAVQLKEDVTLGMIGSGIDFKEGSVLYGRYDKSVWSYCGVATLNTESRVASAALLGALTMGFTLLLEPMMDPRYTNCLYDTDNDGVFDTGWGTGDVASENSMVAFNMTEKSLSVKPAYERVDPSLGPGMPVRIKWQKNRKSPSITFYAEFANGISERVTKAIPAQGSEPAEVSIYGAVFLLESYDAEAKSIRVTVKEGFPTRYVRVPFVRTITYY